LFNIAGDRALCRACSGDANGTKEGDAIVLASGAWMQLMCGTGIELPPIQWAKGQMAALAPPRGVVLPKSLIWSEDVYLLA
jgi:glycine/D-amino acid oxidase-like deaminating enzyme